MYLSIEERVERVIKELKDSMDPSSYGTSLHYKVTNTIKIIKELLKEIDYLNEELHKRNKNNCMDSSELYENVINTEEITFDLPPKYRKTEY
jgi:hypothetical protein